MKERSRVKIMYPVGTGTEEDFRGRWYIALGFGEPQPYGFHEGIDINLKTGGDTDLGEPIVAITDYKLAYYHFKSHPESGFGCHFVYEIDTPRGKRWVHCAHNKVDPPIATKKEGKKGDVISFIGKTGRPRAILPAHLHFSIFKVDPQTLPSGIDTIAKTTKQLNDWWESPLEIVESLREEKKETPKWLETLLQERNLTINNESEIRIIFQKALKYDDEVKTLTEQVKSANENLADKSLEVSLLADKNQALSSKVDELEESLNQARSARDNKTWEAEKLVLKVEKIEGENKDLKTKIQNLQGENPLKSFSWFKRLLSLVKIWR